MEHHYQVKQNTPYRTWRIEELWDGGVIRSPFLSPEDAIMRERVIAEERGFIDTLYLDNAGEL